MRIIKLHNNVATFYVNTDHIEVFWKDNLDTVIKLIDEELVVNETPEEILELLK